MSNLFSFKKCIGFVRWYWLIKLYRFQVCNSTIHLLYLVLCVHHPKSPYPPAPLLTPPSLPSSSSPPLFPCGNHHNVTCVYEVLIFLYLIPSPFSPNLSTPLPSDSCQVCSLTIYSAEFLLLFIWKIWMQSSRHRMYPAHSPCRLLGVNSNPRWCGSC